MAEVSKKRTNYTGDEKKLLCSLVAEYKRVIENKETNAVSNREKDSAWSAVANKFNSRCYNIRRDAESLRKQWSNMKQVAKKEKAQERISRYKTGGGSASGSATVISEAVSSVIDRRIVAGFDNEFDCDQIEDYESEGKYYLTNVKKSGY